MPIGNKIEFSIITQINETNYFQEEILLRGAAGSLHLLRLPGADGQKSTCRKEDTAPRGRTDG